MLKRRSRRQPGALASNGQATPSAYDSAIAVATDAEKERLQALRLRFNIPPDSPEWQFYAVLAPLVASAMGPKEREEMFASLARLEQRADDAAKQPAAVAIPGDLGPQLARLEALLRHGAQAADPFATASRYFAAFVIGALVCELVFGAISWGVFPPVFAQVGFFTLGLSASASVLLWLWLAPIIRAARRGR